MDHKAEAERLTGLVQQSIDATVPHEVAVPMADACALAQVHATLHLAERLDAVARAVRGDGR